MATNADDREGRAPRGLRVTTLILNLLVYAAIALVLYYAIWHHHRL